MEIIYLKSFYNDLKKLKDKKLKQSLKQLLLDIENAETLNDIPNLKKMKGYTIAYRVRIGNYRLGLYYDNNRLEMARFVKRNDIYKLFP